MTARHSHQRHHGGYRHDAYTPGYCEGDYYDTRAPRYHHQQHIGMDRDPLGRMAESLGKLVKSTFGDMLRDGGVREHHGRARRTETWEQPGEYAGEDRTTRHRDDERTRHSHRPAQGYGTGHGSGGAERRTEHHTSRPADWWTDPHAWTAHTGTRPQQPAVHQSAFGTYGPCGPNGWNMSGATWGWGAQPTWPSQTQESTQHRHDRHSPGRDERGHQGEKRRTKETRKRERESAMRESGSKDKDKAKTKVKKKVRFAPETYEKHTREFPVLRAVETMYRFR